MPSISAANPSFANVGLGDLEPSVSDKLLLCLEITLPRELHQNTIS